MNKKKLLMTRSLERIGSFVRLIFMVADGFLIAYLLTQVISISSPMKSGKLINFTPQTIPYIIGIVVAFVVFFALYAAQKLLDKIRENNDYQIDNFEDMVQYSRKRKLPYGQIDDNGEMSIGLLLKRGDDNPMQALDSLIGLEPVKKEVRKIQAAFEYEKSSLGGQNNTCRHYAFLGNPGTGKTTVARIFTGLLFQNGRIDQNKYLECTGNDLTGEYTGQTKIKVDAMFKKAKGGVLFIDEAYVLCEGQNTMASEAVAQLLVHMESDPRTVIIFAGYTENMYRFFKINPGLSSRISKTIFFPDYSSDELVQIFERFCTKQSVILPNDSAHILRQIFEEKTLLNEDCGISSSNGRYARNCFNFVYEQHAFNIITMENDAMNNGNVLHEAAKLVITPTDILDVKADLLLAE